MLSGTPEINLEECRCGGGQGVCGHQDTPTRHGQLTSDPRACVQQPPNPGDVQGGEKCTTVFCITGRAHQSANTRSSSDTCSGQSHMVLRHMTNGDTYHTHPSHSESTQSLYQGESPDTAPDPSMDWIKDAQMAATDNYLLELLSHCLIIADRTVEQMTWDKVSLSIFGYCGHDDEEAKADAIQLKPRILPALRRRIPEYNKQPGKPNKKQIFNQCWLNVGPAS